jgi:D-galactarolactone cycloisomerase
MLFDTVSPRFAGTAPRLKITDVECHVLLAPDYDASFTSSAQDSFIVIIHTDGGVSGVGECDANPWMAKACIEAPGTHTMGLCIKEMLVGADPFKIGELWKRMYLGTAMNGRRGMVIHAMSGIDMALWDLCGKALGKPVHALLGGAFRTRVQPYATGFYRIRGQGEAQRLAEEALRHLEAGFTLMKVKLGYGVDDDIACMQAIARALQGKPVTLMVDTNHAYGRADALRLGRALDGYGLRWYEEPVVPEDVRGYAELRSRLSTPIAGGENEHTLYGFRELLSAGAVDVAQPDVGSCGGITAMRHIAALAQAHGVQVNPHVWGSAIAQAASLQVIAALPVAHHSLYAQEPVLEYDRSSHPFREELVAEPVRLAGGWVGIPARPGLGIEVNRETVERYEVG